MKNKLRVAVIGMGPVGQILAVLLREAGCEVAVLDRDAEKLRLMREEGIVLEGKFRKQARFDSIYDSAAALTAFRPEAILLAVKIYHTPAVIADLQQAGIRDSFFICAQNGIGSEDSLIQAFGDERVFRMVLNFAGNVTAPNRTNVTFFNAPNYLASVDDSQAAFAQQFAAILTRSGLDTSDVDSFWLVNRVWEKTILNASLSALCGITGLTMKEAMARPELVVVVEQLIEESVAVARAEEIYFGENFNKLCLRYLRNAGNHFPSLAIDMQHNRKTEIDYFNGQFVRFGLKHYVKTPLHFAFTNLVKAHSEEQKFMRVRRPQ